MLSVLFDTCHSVTVLSVQPQHLVIYLHTQNTQLNLRNKDEIDLSYILDS